MQSTVKNSDGSISSQYFIPILTIKDKIQTLSKAMEFHYYFQQNVVQAKSLMPISIAGKKM